MSCRVAKILKPRAMAAAARLFRAQINVLAQPRERPPHHIAGQTRTAGAHQECWRVAIGQKAIAQISILGQRRAGGRREWDQAGFTELGSLNHQHLIVQIDVVQVELQRFARPQASGGQQPDQGFEGGAPQAAAVVQPAGLRHQGRNLFVAVNVRRRPAVRCGYEARWRDLGAWISRLQPARKGAREAEPTRRRGRLQPDGQERQTS